jgi:hypothetical protein
VGRLAAWSGRRTGGRWLAAWACGCLAQSRVRAVTWLDWWLDRWVYVMDPWFLIYIYSGF